MSFLNVPGFIKIFFPKQNVENKYETLHQIPIMTIDKEIGYIPKNEPEPKLIFLHTKKLNGYQDLLAKFVELKKKNYEVFLIPEQTHFESFEYLSQNTPKGLTLLGNFLIYEGKMTLNGDKQHPLIKFLKSGCEHFYDFKMLGSGQITQEIGAFVKNTKYRVKYFKKKQFEDFINKQLGIPQTIPVNPSPNVSK